MVDKFDFIKMDRLPNYVFAEVNQLKLKERRAGADIIDFSMGNPDGAAPEHIIAKLVEAAQKPKNHGYSVSKGIYKLRLAITDWYMRKYNVHLCPDTEAVATMGSKEGYVHLANAITNPGDVAIVPDPTYPIHSYAFILSGGNVCRMELPYKQDFWLDEEQFFRNAKRAIEETVPRAKFLIINFPHNPTTTTVSKEFYKDLVTFAKKEKLLLISDIAYADITFDGYKTPSIFEIEGAKDIAVESFTLSKSYNMAGWRVGFLVGNSRIIGALQKIKSWIDYGMFTPIQIAATIALTDDQTCVKEITEKYRLRREILIESFERAGWQMGKPRASMFIWAKIPEVAQYLGSLEFSKQLLLKAEIAVSPGIGFGAYGDKYVRVALIENDQRIRQASRNIKRYLQELQENK